MTKLDLGALKEESGNLTDEQEAALHAQALAELEAPEKKKEGEEEEIEDPEVKDDAQKKDEKKEGEEKETAEEKAEREVAEKQAEADTKQKTLDEALKKKAEERTEEEKTLVTAHEAEVSKKDQEALAQEAEEYADQENVTLEIAKARVEKIRETVKKFEGDPKKMAKALYHTQAAFARSQNELKSFKDKPKEGEIVIDGKKLNKEETKAFIVEKYRAAKPELTEGMEDEKVFTIAKEAMQERLKVLTQKQQTEKKTAADERRAEVLGQLGDRDKPFLEDVKKALTERVDDSEVLDENFSVTDYVYWARGKRYHKDVTDAEARGYERGLAEKKVLGKKGEGSAGGGNGPVGGGKKSGGLSDEDKDRARVMFDTDIPDEKKFELYAEYKKTA